MRSAKVALSTGFITLAASVAAACGMNDETLYCGDEHRYVVEEENCENDDDGHNGTYFIYHGRWPSDVKPGKQLPSNGLSGRVKATDSSARTNLGIPARGGFGGNGSALGGSTGG